MNTLGFHSSVGFSLSKAYHLLYRLPETFVQLVQIRVKIEVWRRASAFNMSESHLFSIERLRRSTNSMIISNDKRMIRNESPNSYKTVLEIGNPFRSKIGWRMQ